LLCTLPRRIGCLGALYELLSERHSTGLAQPLTSSRQGRSIRPLRSRAMDRPSNRPSDRDRSAFYGFCGITGSPLVSCTRCAFGLPLRLFPLALPPIVGLRRSSLRIQRCFQLSAKLLTDSYPGSAFGIKRQPQSRVPNLPYFEISRPATRKALP